MLPDQGMGWSWFASDRSSGIALGIHVDQQAAMARHCQSSRQVHGGGRLANAPFLIGDTDDSANRRVQNYDSPKVHEMALVLRFHRELCSNTLGRMLQKCVQKAQVELNRVFPRSLQRRKKIEAVNG
jgi:hypothetical protein